MPMKQIAHYLGRAGVTPRQRLHLLGYKVPKHIASAFAESALIKKGNVPFNKGKKMSTWMPAKSIRKTQQTRFKKGNLPVNTKHDGCITIRKDKAGRPYQHIRLAQAKWVMLHRYVWENVNGPIPTGLMVRFKDGNTLNCHPSNLQLVNRQGNMVLNSVHRYPEEIKQTIRKIAVLHRKINQHEKQTIRP